MAKIQPSGVFQHGDGSHLGKWRRTVGVKFSRLGMSRLVWVSNLIKIASKMAEIQPSRVIQHGGGGHHGKWRRTADVEFFGFSMLLLV